MKPHQVRDLFKEWGYERGSLYVAEKLAEELIGIQQVIVELAKQLDHMTSIVSAVVVVTDKQKSVTDQVLHIMGKDNEESTH